MHKDKNHSCRTKTKHRVATKISAAQKNRFPTNNHMGYLIRVSQAAV